MKQITPITKKLQHTTLQTTRMCQHMVLQNCNISLSAYISK